MIDIEIMSDEELVREAKERRMDLRKYGKYKTLGTFHLSYAIEWRSKKHGGVKY